MKPSPYQREIYKQFQETKYNINISAVAGSGKTTVLVKLLEYVPDDKSAIFLAFNNSIVDELRQRTPEREGITVSTLHSYGWRGILMAYGSKQAKLNPDKLIGKVEKALKGKEYHEGRKGYYFYIIPKIVDLMRCNLIEPEEEDIVEMLEKYNIDVGEFELKLAIEVFNLSNADKRQFDFMDMIYQPIFDKHIRLKKYDYVFCDESQDFSLAQHEIIKKAIARGGRLVTVGDKQQSIYGFAGADVNSYERLASLNGESLQLPLSVSYRCAKAIVLEAQKYVPEIFFAPNADEGEVINGSLQDIRDGDWVICRNLKPLVVTYLWLLKSKVKSKIRGKDLGNGIISLVNKTGTKTLNGLSVMLENECEKCRKKLIKKGIKYPEKHPSLINLMEQVDVIQFLSNEVNSISELKTMICNIFSDDTEGILLSTIHKSKGLENHKIFFILPELIPSQYATQDWQIEQEYNLKYVGITRAKKSLVYVNNPSFIIDTTTPLQKQI